MKKILLGFAEGLFVSALVIYIVTDLILGKAVNVLFYPETYPFLFGLFYLANGLGNKKQLNRLTGRGEN